MSGHFFAGSFGGDVEKINDATRLECRICWHVYDPALGDDYWQIPPGTPFSAAAGALDLPCLRRAEGRLHGPGGAA